MRKLYLYKLESNARPDSICIPMILRKVEHPTFRINIRLQLSFYPRVTCERSITTHSTGRISWLYGELDAIRDTSRPVNSSVRPCDVDQQCHTSRRSRKEGIEAND